MSLRARLTLVYGALFVATGALLVGVTYLFTVRAVNAKFRVSFPPPHLAPGAEPLRDSTFVAFQGDIEQQLAAQRRAILGQLVQSSVLTIVLFGLLAVGVGYLVSGRMLQPLHTVTATARRLSESNLHERIGLAGPRDEIKDLADTFDGMLDRLHRAFDSQRRFIANASHELRTPLAMARTAIEVALARPGLHAQTAALGRKLLTANDRHTRLIDGLLTLARSEREVRTRTPVDVAGLVANALDPLRTEAEEAGVRVEPSLGPGATAGDPMLLERAVSNLLENAIRYNAPGGGVWLRTGAAAGRPFVTVENTGPTVSTEQVELIFEPFRRLSAARVGSQHGSGLGLSIVRAVMRAHGGNVTATPRSGGGLVVTLWMPHPEPIGLRSLVS